MPRPENIVILNYEYPPVGGGAGQVTQSLCDFFSARGIRQTIITGWVPGTRWLERCKDITIIRVPMLKWRKDRTSVPGMASYLIMAFLPLLYVLLTRKVELIHAHFVVPVGILAMLAKSLFGTPYMVTMHGGDVPGMVPEQTDSLFRWVRRTANAVVESADVATAVSTGLKELASRSYRVPVAVIPNGIDSSWIDPVTEHASIAGREIRLVFVGRLTRQKNVSALLKAVALLDRDRPWRLEIVGDGPLRGPLQKEAGNQPSVSFLGWLTPEQVKTKLSEADIFVLPSFSEGLSMAALQAMAKGCALVVSEIPMNRDVIEEGINGFCCGHDPESIAAAIEKCLPALNRLKLNSIRKASTFLWEHIGEVYLSYFEKIIEGKK
jgi:glycosyltransferase involved in cell wall biosynthesis